jgi:hypothetical protein
MPVATSGVVVDFRAFGTIGTLTPGAHLGRTLSHEVGHYLDLFHIWGDDGSACTGSDLVADTPNQAGSSPFQPTSCRTFPAVSCSNAPDGDMFMNYMDYSADQCMNLFTAGQAVRMDAALHTVRASLLASPGLVPPTGVPGPDLWSQDTSDDIGVEPNPSSEPMYLSNDIWVRTGNDGLANQDHQNAEYRTPGGAPNNVYVRVRNRACSGAQSGTVKLYWAKASSGLSWPAPWDGSVTTPALMGGLIGSAPITVLGGDDEIVSFAWSPPNPADYAVFGADRHHFCLLARIETSSTAPFGMTTPETSNLYANVVNNNNIVWKNISVVDDLPGTAKTTGLTVANFGERPHKLLLQFLHGDEPPTLLEWGRVLVDLPQELAERMREGGGEGIEWLTTTTFALVEPKAALGGVELQPGDVYALGVRFVPGGKVALGARVLTLDVQQFDGDELVGGVRFALRTHTPLRPGGECGGAGPLDGHNWIDGKPGGGCCC